MGLCTFKSPWDTNKNVLWAMFHEALYICFPYIFFSVCESAWVVETQTSDIGCYSAAPGCSSLVAGGGKEATDPLASILWYSIMSSFTCHRHQHLAFSDAYLCSSVLRRNHHQTSASFNCLAQVGHIGTFKITG